MARSTYHQVHGSSGDKQSKRLCRLNRAKQEDRGDHCVGPLSRESGQRLRAAGSHRNGGTDEVPAPPPVSLRRLKYLSSGFPLAGAGCLNAGASTNASFWLLRSPHELTAAP
jgi:hypothetical protein